ncbi:MAG: valine--tRNA ligase, partial [Bacteroidales bacterium]|nr:valine--tRNA ligase [Bacteroidales bacterium]
MEIPARYNPESIEDKWYSYWQKHRLFKSVPDEREPYSVVIPPPNVTGVLHMGHMLNNTIQDVLVRRARMKGKNACWVPGTDHASIATEAKVVAKLKEEGIEKSQLSREEFLQHAWEWKEKHGGIILEQLKKLGASCDWDRTRFTMDSDMSDAVIHTFVYLYNKGWIYRGVRMVNWDPAGCTAVSDEEVIHKEVKEKLYYLRYHLSEDGKAGADYLTVATTRPETIMADVAVCVHSQEPRYSSLVGKKVLIPLINKEIPIIQDEYVSMDFGTGCLKITPAHDVNDYNIGLRHKLPVVDILDERGCLTLAAQILVGEERFAARKKIAVMLKEAGLMEKEEAYTTQVGFSERTDSVIEPKLSMQWFMKMEEPAKQALEYVETDQIKLIPDKFKNTYRHWMEHVRDWCISRQLWWGQRLPEWYLPSGEHVVAVDAEQALELARAINPEIKALDLRQDDDVLDTWFSSWLWPISVFDPSIPGHPHAKPNADLAYYYPTNDLVTAPEILFFWVARMIMAGHEFCGKPPFERVYLNGIVRDKLGRKMSKSLGNSPDPLEMIAKNGADGVRMG